MAPLSAIHAVLEQLREAEGRRESTIVFRLYPRQLGAQPAKSPWIEDPASLVSPCRAAMAPSSPSPKSVVVCENSVAGAI
jgi:hypothetical protein